VRSRWRRESKPKFEAVSASPPCRAIMSPMKVVPPTLTCPELGLIRNDGKRYELVDGEAIVSSSPSEKHQRTSGRLFRRMEATLRDRTRTGLLRTVPIINWSRRILWLVTGREKVDMLGRLRKGDVSIPGRKGATGSGPGASRPRRGQGSANRTDVNQMNAIA
jgi:hypothetical protein